MIEQFQCLNSVGGDLYGVIPAFQKRNRQLLIHHTVLHQQNTEWRKRRLGRFRF